MSSVDLENYVEKMREWEDIAEKAKAEAEAKLIEASKGAAVPEAKVAVNEPPVVEDGISDETVAVIAAAIAAMGAASGKKLALRSVRTAKGARSAWASPFAVHFVPLSRFWLR